MRVEATVPAARGKALDELARDLGLSRSQVIDEAVALFIKVILEARRGRRLLSIGAGKESQACEIATPSLTQIEWANHRHTLHMPVDAANRIDELLDNPPEPAQPLVNLMENED